MQPPSTLQRSAVLTACADMIRACGLTLVELAQELGQPLQAAPVVLPPAMRDPNTVRPRAEQALEHVREAGGLGLRELMAIMGLSMQSAWGYLDELQQAGKVVRVRAVGQRSTRYFTDPVAAQRWVDSHAQAAAEQLQQAVDRLASNPAKPAPFPEPAPVAAPAVATLTPAEVRSVEIHVAKVAGSKKAPAPMGARTPHKPKPAAGQALTITPPKPPEPVKPKGEPIRTEKTVETRDTTVRPTAKWQMQQLPPDPRYPSFSSMRPGVNPDTGKAWEARA